MVKKYLENDICNFTPLFEIDYTKKQNIICISLFKMHGGGYKDFSLYTNGLTKFNDVLNNDVILNNFRIRLFIDKSIYDDNELFDNIKNLNNIDIVLYDCVNFKIGNTHHDGLFGTIVRFFPMFNFNNNDAGIVFMADADFDDINRYIIKDMYKFQLDNNINIDNIYLSISGRLSHVNVKKFTRNNMIIPYILASKFYVNKKISNHILIDFFEEVRTSKNKLYSDYCLDDKYKKKCKMNTKYIFGVDEYFLNYNLLDYLLENKKTISVVYSYNIHAGLFFSYSKNKKNINKVNEMLIYIKYILKNTVDKNTITNIKQALEILDKKLFGDNYFESDDMDITDEQKQVYKRYIKLLRILKKRKRFNIITEEYIDLALDEKNKNVIRNKKMVFYFDKEQKDKEYIMYGLKF